MRKKRIVQLAAQERKVLSADAPQAYGSSGHVCRPKVVRLGDRPPCDNPSVVVTNLPQARRVVYQRVYCAAGDIENRIKEQRLHRVLVAENRSLPMPGTGSSTHSPTRAR